MKKICSKCGREKEVACLVDGKPWCEECLDSNLRLIDGRTGKEVHSDETRMGVTCDGCYVHIRTPFGSITNLTRAKAKMLANQILSAIGEI